MNLTTRPAPHVEEGELVRHLDGELAAGERRTLLAHVTSCSECGQRLRELQASSNCVAELIAALPALELDDLRRARALAAVHRADALLAASHTRRARWPLRIAASIAIVLGAAFTVEPVSAWIGDIWRELAVVLHSEPGAEPTAAGSTSGESPVVAFEPSGETFVIELQQPQRRGAIILRVAEVRQATAQVRGEAAPGLLVHPNGVRIENARGAAEDYLVTLPARLHSVELRLGGGAPIILPLEDIDRRDGSFFDLATRRLRE